MLSVKHSDGASRIDNLRTSGSLRLLFPRQASPDRVTGVLLNTAGGITGGDRYAIRAHARAGTGLTITTQAAERAYRAQPTETGRQDTHLTVDDGADLHWLPQETILFEGSRFRRRLTVDLADDASFLMVEALVFGRLAMGERLRDATFNDRIEIRRHGAPVFLDALSLADTVSDQMDDPARGGGAGALATVVRICNAAEAHLDPIRALLHELKGSGLRAGVSLVRDGMLVLRALAPDSHILRQALVPVLERLARQDIPRPWTI